jgi:hypothetical protein
VWCLHGAQVWAYTRRMEHTSLAKSYRQALSRILARLHSRKGEWITIAAAAGVPYGTLKNIANGHIKNPNVEAIEALDRLLSKRPNSKPAQ